MPLSRSSHRPRRARVAALLAAALAIAPTLPAQHAHPHASAASVIPVGTHVARAAEGDARWSDPATWGGAVPGGGAHVVIPAGQRVVLDGATAALGGITVRGTLEAAAATDVAITAGYVLVDGGALVIGTAEVPFTGQATITLTGASTADLPQTPGFGAKVLAVRGGTLSLHGRRVAAAWTRLAADVTAGATQLTLAQAPGWRPGDSLVVATSSPNQQEHDVVAIRAISGTAVQLTAPLRFAHLGQVRSAGGVPIDLRAEVGLLSHNIVVQGDAASAASGIGGHVMVMDGATEAQVRLARVEFRRLGQLNVVGRYPLHLHLMGAASGTYIRDVAVHSSIQRGIVLHGVQGVELSGSVVFRTVGHNIVLEDTRTTGNRIERTLALVNRQARPLQTAPEFVAQNDRLPSNFWFKAAANVVTGNAAAGAFSSGFTYDGVDGTGPLDFRQNVAHAAMGAEGDGEGDFDLMGGLLIVAGEARPAGDVVADVLVYHNRFGAWPEEMGPFVIDRLVAVENDAQTFNRGVGNHVIYRDPLFVGRLTVASRTANSIVHVQYGSDVVLERPRFVDSERRQLASPTDVASTPQASVRITGGVRQVGTPFEVGQISDGLLLQLDEDGILPRGVYVPTVQHTAPGCAPVRLPDYGDEPEPMWHCARRFQYAELDVRDRARVSTRLHRTTTIRRSDGLTFRDGLHGYSAVLDGGLRYDVREAGSMGHALRLTFDFMDAREAERTQAGGSLPVAIPVRAVPRGVHRTGTNRSTPNAPTATNRLRQARDAADFAANPLTTWLWDAGTRTVHAHATTRWLVVDAPSTTLAAACTPSSAPTGTRAIAALLDWARQRQTGAGPATPPVESVTRAAQCR